MFFAKIADGVTKEKMWMKEEREENIRINGGKIRKREKPFSQMDKSGDYDPDTCSGRFSDI